MANMMGNLSGIRNQNAGGHLVNATRPTFYGGGRARPVARGRGRAMARGGRAPGRRFQVGGGAQCPAGTFRTADGRCTQMGS